MERVLTDFVKALRNANVRVSPAETLDAMEVIDKVGYANKGLLKRTLSIVLSKTPEEKDKFSSCFDDFFTDEIKAAVEVDLPDKKQTANDDSSDLAKTLMEGSQAEIMLAIADAGEESEIREIKYFLHKTLLEQMGVGKLEDEIMQMGSQNDGDVPSDLEQQLRSQLTGLRERVSDFVQQQFLLHGDVSGEQLREQVFKSMNMAQIDRSYLQEVHSLVRKMAKKLANMHSRRKKNFRRGKLDIRKTLRDNWVNQGTLFNLRWSYKKVDRPKIVALCDVSGSVANVSRFFLMFLHSLTDVLPHVRTFAFSNKAGEVTDLFETKDIEVAATETLLINGGGSTDYGQAFSDLESFLENDIDRKQPL